MTTDNRYMTRSINDITAVLARLTAAVNNPRTSNRDQVFGWLTEAHEAYMTALGERCPLTQPVRMDIASGVLARRVQQLAA